MGGRAGLRPVGAITATAREISATDLSRRIPETGPHDELRTLTETINGMLDRIEAAFTPSATSSTTSRTSCAIPSPSSSPTSTPCSPATT